MIKYDYTKGTMTVDGTVYQLDTYREWLLSNHESLCAGHYIRAIKTSAGTRFTFDWQAIFFVAEQYFITDFIQHERVNRQTK